MHKTMLAVLIVATSALTIPAFAQVNLGGATQVGAGVNAGAAVPNAMHTVDQTGAQTMQTLHRADHKAKRVTHKAVDTTRATARKSDSADVGVNAGGSAGIDAGDTHPAANTNVDAGAAIDTVDTAGSVGTAAKQTVTGQSIGADAKVNAKAATHGH